MNSRFSTLCVLLGALALSACGGGANLKFEEQLKSDLAASEARVAELQQAVTDALDKATEATEEATEALKAAAAAEEKAAAAEKKAQDAEAMRVADVARFRQEAEDAKADAVAARAEATAAETRATQAEAQARQAQEAVETQRQAAEERVAEAEKEKEAAEKRLSQTTEEHQFAGFGTDAGTLSVTPRRTVAAIINTPSIGVGTVGTAVDPWAVTSGMARDGTYEDTVAVYSDVDAPTTVPFKDSKYNTNRAVFDADGMRKADFRISRSRTDTVASDFPTTSGTPKSFDIEDRGPYTTQAQIDALPANHPDKGTAAVRADEHKKRWTIDAIEGTLGGATGTFRCESASKTSCTVQKRGDDHFFFSGPWAFRPTAAETTVTVPDEHFMWFGWWAREHLATRAWSYAVGHVADRPNGATHVRVNGATRGC